MASACPDVDSTVRWLLASTPPGRMAAVRGIPDNQAMLESWRTEARRHGWLWVQPGCSPEGGTGRSVVLCGHQAPPYTVARQALAFAHAGARAIVVLGVGPRRAARRADRRLWACEPATTPGHADTVTAALGEAKYRWRADDRAGAARVVRRLGVAQLLETALDEACDLLVLGSLLAADAGEWLEAEALANVVRLATRLAGGSRVSHARASAALARTHVERGRLVPALGALSEAWAADRALDVIAHRLASRVALLRRDAEGAAAHVGALERLAICDPWASVHAWSARASLRAYTRDWRAAAAATARAEEVARRLGWRRRLRQLADLRARVAARRGSATSPDKARRWAVVDDLVALVRTCQEQADEATAIAHVSARLLESLGACGVAVFGRAERQAEPLGGAGELRRPHVCVDAVIAAGVRHPVSPADDPPVGASPIRVEGRTIGALVCEWATGAPIAVVETETLIETAAMVLAPVVRSLAERRRLAALRSGPLADLVGTSAGMEAVRHAVTRAAASPFPVLIEGESGSGKELVARAIHRLSPRGARRFVALNCAAMSDELVEAELFGHTRGAFTGAVSERAGLFEEAADGTLFLDEVAELSPRAQAKLLRALQDGEVRRVGENRPRQVDTRIVAATNRPLADEARAGRFRTDLWYRLDVIRIAVPPLRARLDDVPDLAACLWRPIAARTGSRASLGVAVLDALVRYSWPGNVRELQNVLAAAAVAAPRRGVVPLTALPPHVAAPAAAVPALPLERARRNFDAQYVAAALARAGGRQTLAARELGLTRQGLAKLIARLRLPVEARRADPG
jgi:DNA-binding NtrC family response regulator